MHLGRRLLDLVKEIFAVTFDAIERIIIVPIIFFLILLFSILFGNFRR